jgi:hypothetical protein
MNKKEVRDQIDYVTTQTRKWADYLGKQDSGSYCESASKEYQEVWAVWNYWYKLLISLMEYEMRM